MIFLALFLPLQAAVSFTVLPYIQIDYAHYFRLAQCQAKCTEKYGIPAKRERHDGSVEQYFDVQSEDCKICEQGCHQHRRSHKKTNRPARSALHDGTKFWLESSADSVKIGTTPVSSVELLCQNSSPVEDFEECIDGIIGLQFFRPAGPSRYVVQWKQRTFALGYYDESQWITASIESDASFKVTGLIPGVQYRFMVTVLGPSGRLGDTVSSEWTEIINAGSTNSPVGPLTIKNGFNTEHGVTAHLHWPRTSYDTCNYKLQLNNSTHQIAQEFTIDPSKSFLFSHLEFDSIYSVSLSAISGSKEYPLESKPINTQFNSFQCKEVYGQGSLHCAPEPVSNLKVIVRPNGTAIVSWSPSAETDSILTYQVVYQAITSRTGCHTEPNSVYLKAESTSVEIEFTEGSRCEYLVRLINYDLIGREAFVETRVLFEPTSIETFLHWETMLITACILLIFFLCLILKCRFSKKCPIRVSEKQRKLTEYA